MYWREQPITVKQAELISDMQEFTMLPIPAFKGKNRGEASDYIRMYRKTAFTKIDPKEDSYGNQD